MCQPVAHLPPLKRLAFPNVLRPAICRACRGDAGARTTGLGGLAQPTSFAFVAAYPWYAVCLPGMLDFSPFLTGHRKLAEASAVGFAEREEREHVCIMAAPA